MRSERSVLEWKVKLAVMELLNQSSAPGFRLQVDHATLGPVEIVVGNEEFLRDGLADREIGVRASRPETGSVSRH